MHYNNIAQREAHEVAYLIILCTESFHYIFGPKWVEPVQLWCNEKQKVLIYIYMYFKQYHHVSGNKSLILQRASNSARERCGPYELIPSTALIATHTRDLITKGGTWLTCCH